jgi:hypothetical protein
MNFCIECGCRNYDCEATRIESDNARRSLVRLATQLEEENSDIRLVIQLLVGIIERHGYDVLYASQEDQIALAEAKEILRQ